MKGIRQLKAMFDDPRMKELIVSLWREYPGLYNEKYNHSVGELVEPWLLNNFSEDVQFGQALGQDHSINGNQSTAIGIGAITRAFREMILGSYATDSAPVAESVEAWDELDRLLTIGNGVDDLNRHDAMVLFKSGLLKLFNAIQVGDYAHGTELPADGIIKYLQKRLELSFDGAWHELALKGEITETSFTVTQPGHSFIVGNTIKLSGETWVKTQANIPGNAGTVGLVSEILDADHFKYIVGGLLAGTYADGADYFLSTATPGNLMIVIDATQWSVGQVYEFIGTGTPEGLLIEIDLGHEITTQYFHPPVTVNPESAAFGSIDPATQIFTLFKQSTPILPEDREWGFADIEAGSVQVYDIDVSVSWAYTITKLILVTNTGELTSVTLFINGIAITGCSNRKATTTRTTFIPSANNIVSVGDRVTITVGATFTGAPTYLGGKIDLTRSVL